MASLRDLLSRDPLTMGFMALTAAGLAAGTTTATLRITNGFSYTWNGKFLTKLSANNIVWGTLAATGLLLSVQPEGTTCYYVVSIDETGALYVTQSAIVVNPAPNNFVAETFVFPAPATVSRTPAVSALSSTLVSNPAVPYPTTVIGYFKVVTSGTTASAGFTPGTTAFAATGVTTTFTDALALPLEQVT